MGRSTYDSPDWIGKRYGALTVVESVPHTTSSGVKNGIYWLLKCDCGKTVERPPFQTIAAEWPSCGCERGKGQSKYLDESWIGKRYGRLTVVSVFRTRDVSSRSVIRWTLRCDCGNTVTVAPSKVMNCGQKSCGCLAIEEAAKRMTKHGESHTKLFNAWVGMRNRCNDPKNKRYDRYGGRGISVCPEWEHDYAAFASWARENGYQEDLTIDRIDVDGDYCPENCRWVDLKTQANNKTNNHMVTINGETKTLAEWCDYYGADYSLVYSRVSNGRWDYYTALTTPSGGMGANGITYHPERKKKPVQRKYHVKHHTVTLDGEEVSLREACTRLGLPYQAIHLRVTRYGMMPQDAISKPLADRSQSLRAKCRERNMPYGAVVARIKSGWDEESALSVPINVRKRRNTND